MTAIPQKIIINWWSEQTIEYFDKLVEIFKSVATYLINTNIVKKQNQITNSDEKPVIEYDKNLILAMDVMNLLYKANHLQRSSKLKYDVFHMPELIDRVDLQQDYLKWSFEKNVSKQFF